MSITTFYNRFANLSTSDDVFVKSKASIVLWASVHVLRDPWEKPAETRAAILPRVSLLGAAMCTLENEVLTRVGTTQSVIL